MTSKHAFGCSLLVILLAYDGSCVIASDQTNDPVTSKPAQRLGRKDVLPEQMAQASKAAFIECKDFYRAGVVTVADFHYWSLRWAIDEAAASPSTNAAIAAYERHLKEMKQNMDRLKAAEKTADHISALTFDLKQSAYFLLEARKLLVEAKKNEVKPSQ